MYVCMCVCVCVCVYVWCVLSTCRVWNYKKQKCVAEFSGHKYAVVVCALPSGQIVTGTNINNVCISFMIIIVIVFRILEIYYSIIISIFVVIVCVLYVCVCAYV